MTILSSPQVIHFGILIPCFNHQDRLRILLKRIAENRWRWAPNVDELLVIDDGSEPPVADSFTTGEKISVIRMKTNGGKGAALKAGFRNLLKHRRLSCIVTLDADLQHPPEYIPRFLDRYLTKNADLVLGCRKFRNSEMPWERKLSNRLSSAVVSLVTGRKIIDSQCGYRLYSRRLLENIPLTENGFHLESEAVVRSCRKKYKIVQVAIPTIYGGEKSAIKHFMDTVNFIQVVLGFLKDRLIGNV